MKIVAIMPVRNEEWCLGFTLRALLKWVDAVVVGLHACTDRSEEIAREIDAHTGRVHAIWQNDTEWREMDHRQALLEKAREIGGTHIVTVDADEVLTANLLPRIRHLVLGMESGSILQIPWVQMVSRTEYISDGQWAYQAASTAFVDEPALCWRPQEGGYHFHHRQPMGKDLFPYQPMGPGFLHRCKPGGLIHMQMMEEERLRAKHALYVMQETVRWPGRKTPEELNAIYGGTVAALEAPRSKMPAQWLAPYGDIRHHLQAGVTPWQWAAARELWAKYGGATFAGLDLYGLEV